MLQIKAKTYERYLETERNLVLNGYELSNITNSGIFYIKVIRGNISEVKIIPMWDCNGGEQE